VPAGSGSPAATSYCGRFWRPGTGCGSTSWATASAASSYPRRLPVRRAESRCPARHNPWCSFRGPYRCGRTVPTSPSVGGGPAVTTRSRFDTAVGRWYPLGAGAARQVDFAPGELPRYGGVGAFGLQGPGLDLVDLALQAADRPYEFRGGRVFNLECSGVIRNGGGAAGAHNDIAHPEVAHAVWAAALA
jgi:hypothetical protein